MRRLAQKALHHYHEGGIWEVLYYEQGWLVVWIEKGATSDTARIESPAAHLKQ